MERIEVLSPAKINLGLNIISRREDGFHNLETIFYPVNIFDMITIEKSNRTTFETNNELLNAENTSNLILKALSLLEEKSNQQLSCKIFLDKRIPTGAGLGGGSSNAAVTLVALNNFFELNIESSELRNLALQLGSDVPFFLFGKPCFAEGRGEIITPISLSIPYPILLVNPRIHISTAWAFNNITPAIPKYSLKKFADDIIDFDKMKMKLVNDFEKPVFASYPEIRNIKIEMMRHGAIYSQMSGSGSTVFGIFNDESAMKYLQNYFLQNGYHTFISEV